MSSVINLKKEVKEEERSKFVKEGLSDGDVAGIVIAWILGLLLLLIIVNFI